MMEYVARDPEYELSLILLRSGDLDQFRVQRKYMFLSQRYNTLARHPCQGLLDD